MEVTMNHHKNSHKRKEERHREKSPPFQIKLDEMKNYNHLVETAQKFGERLERNRIKSSQFRRVFTHIKKIQINMESKDYGKDAPIPEGILKEVLLLKPKIAYTAGRHENIRDFYDVMVQFVNDMETVGDFNRFYDFVEASLAYHRYYSEIKGKRR
jgi:CRISPR-associated protein Csm2